MTRIGGTPNADLLTEGGGAARNQMRDGNQIWAGIRHRERGFVGGGQPEATRTGLTVGLEQGMGRHVLEALQTRICPNTDLYLMYVN